jgi:putative ABC transport system ATP-binding protein
MPGSMTLPDHIHSPETPRETVLSGRALVKDYGNAPALRGVSVELGRGEILAVTGPSGSGKSTLLLCMAGVLRPDAGEVHFQGRRIDTDSETDRSLLRRDSFGVLFQFGQLITEMTAAENVALPLLLSGARRRPAMMTARDWLRRFGVEALADQLPTQMSGGQSQRVAVARALVTEPAVLFADEPTAALDTVAGEQVMTELTRVARETGTAVLLITHDARVAAYGDREIVVRDGLCSS